MADSTSGGRAPHVRQIIGLAAGVIIFASPTLWRFYWGEMSSYAPVTLAAAAAIILLAATWPQTARPPRPLVPTRGVVIAGLVAAGLVGLGLNRWLDAALWQPIDAMRADMLVVIEAAIRALLNGRDPYALYRVPWEAPLPYGPVLWTPFIIPHLLNADLRLVTITGEAFVPVWCGVAAVVEAARERSLTAVTWLVLLAVLVLNPDLVIFTAVGHTPAYWPLIPLFALFIVAEQWPAAAATLGLLVVGRTTMVAIVPVFFIAVWSRDRARMRSALVLAALPVVLLLAPFAVWNPWTLWDGLVASYPRVMKQVVWPSPDGGAIRTVGITGLLLKHQLQAFVEVVQACVLAVVYLLAWRALRRNAAPLPWMALALLAFCMTTLWPVYYVHFDVLLLLVSAALAETLNAKMTPWREVAHWSASLAATAAAVGVTLMIKTASFPVADLAAGEQRPLYKGFVPGRGPLAGSALIRGTEGSVALPRRSSSPADILIGAQPIAAGGGMPQAVTATLNGVLLGTIYAGPGWGELRFRAPQRAWRVGANMLELRCSSSVAPSQVGLGNEARQISLAVRRIKVMPSDAAPR